MYGGNCILCSLSLCVYAAHASCGFVHITGEEVEESKFDIRIQMYAKKLDKKDFFGKVCVYDLLCSVCVCVRACVRVCVCACVQSSALLFIHKATYRLHVQSNMRNTLLLR